MSAAPNLQHRLNNYTLLDKPQQPALNQQQRRLSYEQLKSAVSSNLPCFLIEYDPTESSKNRPSDVLAAGMFENHFKEHRISIRFSILVILVID